MATVFVSYRIADSAGQAGRIADALRRHFGADAVFLSDDNITKGTEWRPELLVRLSGSRVVVVVMGPSWLTVTGNDGVPRIQSADDIVRMEIREALALARPTIPVLVGDARLPKASELPADIAPLLNTTMIEVRNGHWATDIAVLVRALAELVPALRVRDFARRLVSIPRSLGLAAALTATVVAVHLVLVRVDWLDAYTLRNLPYVLALLWSTLFLLRSLALRRMR